MEKLKALCIQRATEITENACSQDYGQAEKLMNIAISIEQITLYRQQQTRYVSAGHSGSAWDKR